ncbi:acyl-CoA-binding domain-containing protein 4 isoform X5 [Fukomys damarensis]|uniref:acyl-CoA-binding domain-containing protein 4 isoform X5 n=1 Tax=Fukomys damarensis TaxID=885580 RepID=UPI00053FA723|nr:acyl-CoA-binding domain-containing protein 4 isoform X5 [Fukomys damarensis]
MGTERGDPEPACREQFQAAVSVIQSLPRTGSYRPSYEEMLRFYSYYKQATLGPCLAPRPGFWDPIGRYKWDAWHSLGRMSKEEAMSAYVAEIKLVAQKVIDTVPLGEVAEDAFAYFAPLYQVIPNMPRPPEAFLRRITGCKEQVLCRDDGAIPGPPYLSTEPAPPGPESQTPRDLDLDIFCDSLEQLEPELVRPPCLPLPSPEAAPVPLPRLVTQVWAEQRGAAGRDPKTKTSLESPEEKEELGGGPQGSQELDKWLVGTVRALQESMQDVQGRLRSLESKPRPPAQVSRLLQQSSPRPHPDALAPVDLQGLRPRPLRLSAPTLLFFLLWPFVVQWLLRQLRTQKR